MKSGLGSFLTVSKTTWASVSAILPSSGKGGLILDSGRRAVKEKFCPGRPTGRDLQRLRNLVREYCLGRLGFSDPDRGLEADRGPAGHPEPRVPGLIIRLIGSEEMRMEVLFLYEKEG